MTRAIRHTLVLSVALAACTAEGDLPDGWLHDEAAQPAPEVDPMFRAPLVLSVSGLEWGQTLTVTVSGADPAENVHLLWGVDGDGGGPCPVALGGQCVDVVNPTVITQPADAAGTAVFTQPLPASGDIFAHYTFQAVAARGAASLLSNTIMDYVDWPAPPSGTLPLAILGSGTHDMSLLTAVVLAERADGLRRPTDVEFDNMGGGSLLIPNQDDNSMSTIDGAMTASPVVSKIGDFTTGRHFNARPTAVAFGPEWDGYPSFAHAPDQDQCTQSLLGLCTEPDGFMGPTWHSTRPDIFDAGHGGHLDMLHNSENSVGVAYEGAGSVWWIYDGSHGSLTRYDFRSDHGPGGSDHTDGVVVRFLDGVLGYVPDVGSHIAYDTATDLVYAADTENNEIRVLDATSGTLGADLEPNFDGSVQKFMDGATSWVLIDGAAHGLVMPSGLELVGSTLFVTDYATARVFAFDLAGTLLDWFDTGGIPGSVMGMEVGADGDLYLADPAGDRVVRIEN